MISKVTKRAVSIVALIAKRGLQQPINTHDISSQLGISVSHTERIIASLKRQGIVRSVIGPGGGYQVAGNVADINVWDVIKIFDQTAGQDLSQLDDTRDAPLPYEIVMYDYLRQYLSTQMISDAGASSAQADVRSANTRSPSRSNHRASSVLSDIPNSVFQWHKFTRINETSTSEVDLVE